MSDIADNGSFNLGLANLASQNYGPTAITSQANTAANTQLEGAQAQNVSQQAQAAAMQNQLMRARLPLILSQLHDESVGAGDSSGTSTVGGAQGVPTGTGPNGGGAGPNEPQGVAAQDKSSVAPDQNFYQPDKIDAALRSQYFVPQYTPQEMQALKKAYLVDPQDQYGMGPKRVMAMHDMRIQQATQQNQMDARDDFDKMRAVTDAPEGGAMDVLEAAHPDTVKAIRRQFAKDPSAAMDEDAAARMFAAHVAGAVHQYTGREAVKGDDGVYRDKETGFTIPGVEKVGLSTEQYLKLAHEAIAPTQMDDGSGGKVTVPAWKAAQIAGAKNINGPGDWMMVNASQRGLPGAASTLSPNSAPKQEARAVAAKALAVAQKQQASASAPADGTSKMVDGVGTARNAQGNVDPKLTTALQDPKFSYKPSNNGVPWEGGIGKTPPPPVMEDMSKQTAARNDLAKTSSEGVGAASAALTMYKAAQDVLAKGAYNGGAWNAELAKYSKWLPAGWQDHMTGDYQEVAKYLGNAALQSGKGIFAKMTEKESDAVMHDLNPSPGMDPRALNDMIARGIKTAQYSLNGAKLVPAYLTARKDANQFPTWYQTHYPMEDETKPTPGEPNKAGGKPPKYNDAQVRAYMQKHGLTDEQATRKALGL
jgi:hypothetical protein